MIYYYFHDKEGLYRAVLERSHAELLHICQQLDVDNLTPDVALEHFLVALLDCLSRNPKLPMIMFHEAVYFSLCFFVKCLLYQINREYKFSTFPSWNDW
jgi:AcrR family transcriptional regulator